MTDDTESPFVTVTPTVKIDWDHCESLLDGSEMSEEEKKAFIESLWSIILSVVDLGFGLHPAQQSCGQSASLEELNTIDVVALLELSPEPAPLQPNEVSADDGQEESPDE
ncbi:MAG: hypothetical protein AAF160_19300 [Pseudomonadota bacterium]